MILMIASLLLLMPKVHAINAYKVKDYPCHELQRALKEEGVVKLKFNFLGSTSTHYESKERACLDKPQRSWEKWEAKGVSVLSGDRKFCFMGYRCMKKEND